MSRDVAKCDGEGCKVKEMCYRYTSKEEFMQSNFKPEMKETIDCEYFLLDD